MVLNQPPQDFWALLASEGEGELAPIFHRARALEKVARILAELLPPPMVGLVHVGNIKNNQLTVIVGSPVLASRIRIGAPRMVEAFNERGLPISAIRAKVSPHYTPPGPPPDRPASPPLSEFSRQKLLELAAEFAEGDSLRATIEGLANARRKDCT